MLKICFFFNTRNHLAQSQLSNKSSYVRKREGRESFEVLPFSTGFFSKENSFCFLHHHSFSSSHFEKKNSFSLSSSNAAFVEFLFSQFTPVSNSNSFSSIRFFVHVVSGEKMGKRRFIYKREKLSKK